MFIESEVVQPIDKAELGNKSSDWLINLYGSNKTGDAFCPLNISAFNMIGDLIFQTKIYILIIRNKIGKI